MPTKHPRGKSIAAPAPPRDLEIRPLTPDGFADLAALIEEGGDPKWCWYQSQVGNRRK
jgi:hypothetical protein